VVGVHILLQELGHLLASDAVSVEGGGEVLHHGGAQVSGAADHTILDGLDGLGNLTQDPQPGTSVGELHALELLHLEPEVPD